MGQIIDITEKLKQKIDPNIIYFQGEYIVRPLCREDYLKLCKIHLTKEDYEDLMMAILDKEYYQQMEEKGVRQIVDCYYTYPY